MNRRDALKQLATGSALGFTGAVIISTTSCAPTEAPAAERSIASMFEEWFAIIEETNQLARSRTVPDAVLDERCEVARKLQNRIIRATPSTPRDVAMQFYVDTGNHESEISDEFGDRLLAMALAGRIA